MVINENNNTLILFNISLMRNIYENSNPDNPVDLVQIDDWYNNNICYCSYIIYVCIYKCEFS